MPTMGTGSASEENTAKKVATVYMILEELLGTFEDLVTANKKIKTAFGALLKKKFIDNAEKYAFVDPFAAEFEYTNRAIAFYGDASDQQLAAGVVASVIELAEELGNLSQLRDALGAWNEKHAAQIEKFGIRI